MPFASRSTRWPRNLQLQRYYCYAEHDGGQGAPDAVGLLNKATLERWLPATRATSMRISSDRNPSCGPSSKPARTGRAGPADAP
jgi:hypothetical protein